MSWMHRSIRTWLPRSSSIHFQYRIAVYRQFNTCSAIEGKAYKSNETYESMATEDGSPPPPSDNLRTKKRWTQQQRRERNEEHKRLHMSGASNKNRSTNKERNGGRKPKGKQAVAQMSPRQRQVACADKAFHTGSVRMLSYNDGDCSSKSALSEPLPVVTTCMPLHPPAADTSILSTVPLPTVFVQPLLVLDLNGILCHRMRQHRQMPGARYRSSVARVANTPIIPRMHLTSFLSYLDAHFTLAVWTSATTRTANQLVSLLIPPPIVDRLLFVWSQPKCDKLNPEAAAQDIVFVKSLDKVWKEYPMLWDASNTLLMDDSPEKCPVRFQKNTLHPPSLTGQQQHRDAHLRGGGLYGYGMGSTATGMQQLSISPFVSTTATTLSDEENEARQMRFFQWMVRQYLHLDASGDPEYLFSFLRENAVQHMGWRGPGTNEESHDVALESIIMT